MTAIETRIRAAIDRARERSSSIPDIERLFISLKTISQKSESPLAIPKANVPALASC
jgi:hypothetical protein